MSRSYFTYKYQYKMTIRESLEKHGNISQDPTIYRDIFMSTPTLYIQQ